jgi:hypothetical protein
MAVIQTKDCRSLDSDMYMYLCRLFFGCFDRKFEDKNLFEREFCTIGPDVENSKLTKLQEQSFIFFLFFQSLHFVDENLSEDLLRPVFWATSSELHVRNYKG